MGRDCRPTSNGVSAMGPDVVVVLSYRGRDDTLPCVESLVDGNPEAQVLVVDNGSGDGVLEAVRAAGGRRSRPSRPATTSGSPAA